MCVGFSVICLGCNLANLLSWFELLVGVLKSEVNCAEYI